MVLETENLKGGGAERDEVSSLERLMAHLREQSFGLRRLRELVITHEGLDDAARERIERAADRRIDWVLVDEDAGYYGSKDRGFDATTSDVVAFADADCWPAARWLYELTDPLQKSRASVIAGRTAYRDDPLGAALTTIDFMYFARDSFGTLGNGDSGKATRNFYANNVAFDREVFARFRYGGQGGFYRGTCQVLGLRLRDAGIQISYAHDALTTHRLPDSVREAAKLRMLRGGDSVELAPHIAERVLPRGLRALVKVPGLVPAVVLGGRLLFSFASVNRQGLTARHGAERAKVAAVIAAASAMDAAGALGRSLGLHRAPERVTLSYHSDVDRLAA